VAALVALVALLVGSVGVLLFIAWREQARPMQSMCLRFGSDVTEGAVLAMLGVLSGLPRGSLVLLDVLADGEGIGYKLHAADSTLDIVRGQVRGLLPGARLEPVERSASAPAWLVGCRLRWAHAHPILQEAHAAGTAAALLGAFAELGDGERLLLRWHLMPTGRPQMPQQPVRAGRQATAGWLPEHQLSVDHLRLLRRKYAGPLLMGSAVVAAQASSVPRAGQLLSRIVATVRSRSSSTGRLAVRRVHGGERVRRLLVPSLLHRGSRLSPAELAGLLAWPVDAPRIPGLSLGTAPQLMPPLRLPTTGRVYGCSNWPGLEHCRLAQPVTGGLSHALLVGPTGSGKSHLMASLIAQDIAAGRGCLVLDAKGDLATDVLARIPAGREPDVIVLDPSLDLPVPGLRLFQRGSDPELTADLILGIFRELFANSWGVRSDRWLRAGLVTLAHDTRATLAHLPLLFGDELYRRRLVGQVADPLLHATWAEFEAMSAGERSVQLGAPLTKVSEVIGRRVVRGVLAQPEPKLDLRAVLRRGQVVVVNVAPGQIGTPAARLIAALVVHELFGAVQARAALPAAQRRPFFAYVDEPKVLGDMPVPIDSLFELARGLGVGLVLGAQSLTQLPLHVQRAALTNAATIAAFRQSADDAKLLARELPALTVDELQHLGQFEIAVRLGLGPGDTAPVATGVTLPLPAASSNPAAIRLASSRRYGVELATVDAALAAVPGTSPAGTPVGTDAPVGRLRRTP